MSRKARPQSNPIVSLSGAGVLFILMGLLALSFPTTREGVQIWQLGANHTFYLMDIVGVFIVALGTLLTWLGGMFWKRQLH